MIHQDNGKLKSEVINNLVPEPKRDILFSTKFSDDSMDNDQDHDHSDDNLSDNNFLDLKNRIEKLEIIVRKLVEYLAKDNGSEMQ